MTLLHTLQSLAYDWGVRCFGHDHMNNRAIRALRFTEEAMELAQACGVPKEKVFDLLHVVYSRPAGEVGQELGGCMVTLSVLARNLQWGLEEAFEVEVRRCLAKTPEHFAKRNQEKLDLGLSA